MKANSVALSKIIFVFIITIIIFLIKTVTQDMRSNNGQKSLNISRAENQRFKKLRHLRNTSKDMHQNSSFKKELSYPSNEHVKHLTKQSISTHLKISTYKSATILISMVILFLLTHFYRVTLKIYEISTPKHNMKDFTFCISKDRLV